MSAIPDTAAAATKAHRPTLADLGIAGNGQITALVRADGSLPWCCWPRPDGDPIFCGLLRREAAPERWGVFDITLVDQIECELRYERNTAILESHARDAHGNAVRITTWCPRYMR